MIIYLRHHRDRFSFRVRRHGFDTQLQSNEFFQVPHLLFIYLSSATEKNCAIVKLILTMSISHWGLKNIVESGHMSSALARTPTLFGITHINFS